MNLYQLIRPLIFRLEPEKAHNLAITLLKYLPRFCTLATEIQQYPVLNIRVFDIDFENPIGMAAGFDKNAEIFATLFNFGFGFAEVGTVTPKPQIGNPKPRLFRLEEDSAIINRFGFNNCGAEKFIENLINSWKNANRLGINPRPLGINIGKNKDSEASADYDFLLKKFIEKGDYITINISSPNTKNLRDLQNPSQLDDFLGEIAKSKEEIYQNYINPEQKIALAASSDNKNLEPLLQEKKMQQEFKSNQDPKDSDIYQINFSSKKKPILLKIAPDLDFDQQQEIAQIALKYHDLGVINGLIISNTTIQRSFNLISKNQNQQGGLSGKPLFELSNEVLKNFCRHTKMRLPIIAVGGISCGNDVFEKICLGASLVQIYSSLIYQGFGLVEKIKSELDLILKQKGFKNISQAIGSKL